MLQIRDEIRAQILQAIELAQGFGACAYVSLDNKPSCVFAQFAYLRGVTSDVMLTWRGVMCQALPVITDSAVFFPPELANITPDEWLLLGRVQAVWDNRMSTGPIYDADEARAIMRQIVAEA